MFHFFSLRFVLKGDTVQALRATPRKRSVPFGTPDFLTLRVSKANTRCSLKRKRKSIKEIKNILVKDCLYWQSFRSAKEHKT
jgi:hypothetical protein